MDMISYPFFRRTYKTWGDQSFLFIALTLSPDRVVHSKSSFMYA
ncbi:uncharacterized protein ARMOST_02961 [Armillaria ostoyae]|uniref:Uncharacterized protein n=1 Tax=Armillaria ostoyae TaxID=47428 RepID=A0A284QTC5_ARMOS|nr:uncharacterized protein ARMOST_02961 [Armillaria ostoyae]